MGFHTLPFKQRFLSGMAFSIYVENDITNAKGKIERNLCSFVFTNFGRIVLPDTFHNIAVITTALFGQNS